MELFSHSVLCFNGVNLYYQDQMLTAAELRRVPIKEALANGRVFRNDNYAHYNGLYTELESLANKYEVGVDAVSLKFCEQTIPGSIILSGASNTKQLEENLKVDLFTLSENELEKLRAFRVDAEQYWQERKRLSWN